MLVFFALGNAKVLAFALADAKVPNASSFAFWWNIGFTIQFFPSILCSLDCLVGSRPPYDSRVELSWIG